MIDERSLQELRTSFERGWLRHATDKELALLELSAERPELFEKGDPSEIRVLLSYDPFGKEGETLDAPFVFRVATNREQATVTANAAALVFGRTRLRARLGLPQNDCAQPQRYGPGGTCTCLTQVLDSIGNTDGLDREAVLKAARKLHKRSLPRLRVRKREPKPKPKPAPVPEPPAPPLPKLTENSTRPGLKQRLRPDRGDPHPLSYAAFKRSKSGPSIRGIRDRKF